MGHTSQGWGGQQTGIHNNSYGWLWRFDHRRLNTGSVYLDDGGASNYFAGNVGIGTANPGAKLDVAGQIKITGGAPAAGKVLTSDAAGLASWQTAGLVVTGGGFIPSYTTANLGSNWTLVSLNGQFSASDSGSAGGYIYKKDANIYAKLFSATVGHNEFTLSSYSQCSGSGSNSLCAWLNGSDLMVRTGGIIQVSYVLIK